MHDKKENLMMIPGLKLQRIGKYEMHVCIKCVASSRKGKKMCAPGNQKYEKKKGWWGSCQFFKGKEYPQ